MKPTLPLLTVLLTFLGASGILSSVSSSSSASFIPTRGGVVLDPWKGNRRYCNPFPARFRDECHLRHRGRSKRSNNIKDFSSNFKKHSRNSEKSPSLRHTFQETTVRPGVYVSLSCVAQGMPVPHITWAMDRTWSVTTRPGVRVNSYVATRHEVRAFVNFTMVEMRDSGVYTCSATNPSGSVSHSARLNVMGPLFMRSPQNVSAVAGQTNYVECPFGGYPFNEVKWERDGRTLPTNQRQQVFDNGTLAIIEVDKAQDEGKYSCSVNGMDGKLLVTSFHVDVKVRPKVAPFSFQNNLQESSRTAVTCVVLGGDPPMRLWWQKDGVLLNENDLETNVLTAEDGFFSTLNIKHLYVRHNGNYSCIAQNSVGSDYQSAILRVKVAPRWLLEPKDTSAVVGNSVTIDCQAEGVPEPHVRWKVAANTESPRKNYKTLISSSRIQILVNGSLSIRGVQKSDAGGYLCEANNGVGSGLSTVITLNAFSVPSTFPKSQSIQVVKGHSILLNCSATGDLPIRFAWNKEGELFSPGMDPRFEVTEKLSEMISTSTLAMDGVERRDSGLFLCTARNDYGSDTTRLMVKVQEKPDPPKGLRAKETESRSVTLTWSESFSGNLPLLRYIVMWRLADANWVRNIPPLVVPGTETSITVPDLKPLTSYVFQIKAENSLGSSDFSSEFTVTTLDEPPRFAPTGVRATSETSQSVTVIWEVPQDVSNSTHIDGFFVGIKQKNSREQYSFKTIDRKSRQEARLDSLIPATDYSVIVQAFNAKGPGPASEEIIARTLEYDPPEAPSFRVSSTSASSIQLTWVTDSTHFTPITGYKIYYKTEEGPLQETHAGNATTVFNVRELKCGTKYGFYIAAYNRAGRSDPTKIIYASTDGGPPEVPDERDLFSVNSTYVVVHLRAWKSGGCPITFFVIQYRLAENPEWTLVSNNIIPQQQHIYIYDLTPATWYVLSLTAHNDAGSTAREYQVGTLTLHGEYPPTLAEKSNANSALQRHFTITIPIASSVIVLVVVLLVVYVITRRRNAPQRLNSVQGGDTCEHTKNESLPLSVTGDHAMEPAYLMSHYGVARSQSQRETACQRQKLDDNLRTFGRPQSDHVYDVPFPVKRAEASRSYPQYNSRSPVPSEREYSYKKPSYRKGGKRYRSRSWREGDGSSGNDSDSEYLSDVLMTAVQNIPIEGSETESDRQYRADFHDEFVAGKMPKQRDVLIHGRSIVV